MLYSQLLIPTLREAPSDAEVASHMLMMRAGYIRKLAAGVYTLLPLCLRVISKIENIIREEMVASGAQELLLPIVMPAEIWQETGRWEVYGKELLRFKDRHERDFLIGPTHEEAITDLVRHEIRSYRDLPKNLFQIQTKFRDEIRPRFGLMRSREFIMKDSYSFDRNEKDAQETYKKMFETYKRIFTRCGLEYRPVEAMTGTIGGSMSHEFQVLAKSGEDEIVSCSKCGYAANVEKAEIGHKKKQEAGPFDSAQGERKKQEEHKKVSTPGQKTVEDVCAFLKVKPNQLVKTLILETDKGLVACLVRGDHALKEAKIKEVIGSEWCHLAEEDAVRKATGAASGYSGPIGLKIPIYADYGIEGMAGFVIGANEDDAHYISVNLGDFKVTKFADIRRAVKGDSCPHCDGVFEEHRGIEVGQVFYLGTKYSEVMHAVYLDENGKEQVIVMGCYGIGVGRTAAAAIEQNHDDKGICWPVPIAPFAVEVIPLSVSGKEWEVAQEIYNGLLKEGVEVLLDDRDLRPGVKFADADLVGIPYQVIIGGKGLAAGQVEVKERKTRKVEKIKPNEVSAYFKKKIK